LKDNYNVDIFVFCFLVDNPASVKLYSIHQITSKQQRCPVAAFFNESKEYCTTAG